MALKIKHKILLIIALNSMFLVMVGAIAYLAIDGINDAKDNLLTNSELNKRLLTALNARDNMRAIVYQGMVLDQSNPAEKKELNDGFLRQTRIFHENIESLNKVNIDPEFDSVITKVVKLSREYQKTASVLLEKELSGDLEAFIIMGSFVDAYNALLPQMADLTVRIDASYNALALLGNQKASTSLWSISIVSFISITTAISISLLIANSISRRILRTKNMIADVGLGKIPEKDKSDSRDEIGEMLGMLNRYLDAMELTSKFAVEIGQGNFDTAYKPLSDHDRLGISLVDMCANLKRVSLEDKRRHWAISGLAKFNEILREDSDNLEKLTDRVTSAVVQYLNFNQGCLYIVEEHEGVSYLSLKATYAWGRKKFVEQRVEQGQGLLGQVWLEGEPVYMTDVPREYVKITSGLGETTPRSILILPLKSDGRVYGILEMAALQRVEVHEQDFLKKISESIAATLAAICTSLQTKALLTQAQEQAKKLREKEEVNLQNMEELQATQEEIVRKEKEYVMRIDKMTVTIEDQHKQIAKLEQRLMEAMEVQTVEKLLTANTTFSNQAKQKSTIKSED